MFLLGYFYHMYDVTALFLPFFPRHINIYICLATVGFMFNIKITNKQTKNKKQKKQQNKTIALFAVN